MVGSYTSGFPTIASIGNATQGGFSTSYGMGVGAPVVNYQNKPTAVLSLGYVHGNHTYKAGVQWRKDPAINKNSIAAPTYAFTGNETALPYLQTTNMGGANIGLPYASFLLGLVDSASIPPTQDPGYTKASMAVYVQDTWKVTRRLTVDYGIRWDYQQAPEETTGRSSMFGPTVANPTAGGLAGGTIFEGNGAGRCNCKFTTTYPYAVGPRIGVAYQLSNKMVVRAGWGISYGSTADGAGPGAVGVGWNSLSFTTTSFGQPATTLSKGLVYNLADVFAVNYSPGIRPQVGQINNPPQYMDRNGGKPPRINQWNIAVQRQVSENISVEAAYVGNHGVWLQSSSFWDLNALTPDRIAQFGLNINTAADRSLLTSTLSSATATARGFNKLPYTGFPATLTVAQSLRPYPQFGSLVELWAPLGDTWYDALQMKATKRTSFGLSVTVAYTRSKTLNQRPVQPPEPEGALGFGPAECVRDLVQLRYAQAGIEPDLAHGARRLDSLRGDELPERRPACGSRGAEQPQHVAIPQHLVEPDAGRAAIPDGPQRPRRSQQAVPAEPGGMVRSGRWTVGLFGALLQRLPQPAHAQ
jgi:hypothetical protein